jgi:hypothetical protein
VATTAESNKARLIILADTGNEPDEEQQMVHMLMCSNRFDLDGLIAVTGAYLRTKPQPELFHRLLDGYAEVLDNLRLHADGWHTTETLRSITGPGQHNYGMADVGGRVHCRTGRHRHIGHRPRRCLRQANPRHPGGQGCESHRFAVRL